MMKKVYIELTEEQKRKLFGVQDKIAQSNELGEPALALAQIHFTGRDAVIICAVIPHEQAQKVIEIVSPQNVGKLAGDTYALQALKKARK